MWLVYWKNYWKYLSLMKGVGGIVWRVAIFLNFGTGSRCLLRGPRPDGQREGRHPRQPGGRRGRSRSLGSRCCCCCCWSPGPDAKEDEGRRLKEGHHAKDGRADGRRDVDLLKSTTGNNYYWYLVWTIFKFYAFLKIARRATKKCAVIWVSWR